jgi:hypothetical protein
MSPLPVLETPAVATHLNTYWSCKTALAWKSRRFFHPLISLLSCRRRLRLLLVTTSSTIIGGSHRLAKAPFRFYRLLLQPSVQIEPMWWKRFTLL